MHGHFRHTPTMRNCRSFACVLLSNQIYLTTLINSNRQPISHRFGVIRAYCSNFGHFAFLSHPLGV